MVGWLCLRFRYQVVVGGMENHRWGGHLSDYDDLDHLVSPPEYQNQSFLLLTLNNDDSYNHPLSFKNRGANTPLRKTDCLSMFCSPATTSSDSKPNTHNPEGTSPLPFGGLPPQHSRLCMCGCRQAVCLHCLSAFCPSATSNTGPRDHTNAGLHCLSAFCPSATPASKLLCWQGPQGRPGHDRRNEPAWLAMVAACSWG